MARCFCCNCVRQKVARNGRARHGQARQVLGEDRSRQPMIGAAVVDPQRRFTPVNCRIAKGSIDHGIAVAQREGRQWPPFAIN